MLILVANANKVITLQPNKLVLFVQYQTVQLVLLMEAALYVIKVIMALIVQTNVLQIVIYVISQLAINVHRHTLWDLLDARQWE